MVTAGEIADFARDYFESPNQILTPETDLVFLFGQTDPDKFEDFLETISKRHGVKLPDLRDMAPGADTRPRGILPFIRDVLFRKIDMEVVFVDKLTIAELCKIIEVGKWPEELVTTHSEARRRQSESTAP
jgi:hypothetical protein